MNIPSPLIDHFQITWDELGLLERVPTPPPHMKDRVISYVLLGSNPGGFLTAVLENKLYEAAGRADETNRYHLFLWAQILEALPGGCWGNPDKVKRWQTLGGLRGLRGQAPQPEELPQ